MVGGGGEGAVYLLQNVGVDFFFFNKAAFGPYVQVVRGLLTKEEFLRFPAGS
jgi:hypothetical protein